MTRLAAVLAALLAMPALAQHAPAWPRFADPRGAGVSIAVDPASIAKQGSRRTFRGRLGKEGDSRSVMLTMVGDCSAQTIGVTRGERYVDGKRVDAADTTGAARQERPVKGDPSTTAMLAFVCKR